MHDLTGDIGAFIFVEDEPRASDAIFVVGGSHPELGEKAAALWHAGYEPRIVVGGGVSVKTGAFPGAHSKRALYPGPYATECAFFCDALRKCGVPEEAILGEDRSGFTRENWAQTGDGIRRVLGELSRCGNQFGAQDVAHFMENRK